MKNKETPGSGIAICIVLLASCIFLLSSCVSLKTPKREDLVPLKEPMLIGNYPVRFNRTLSKMGASNAARDTVVSTVLWYFLKNSEGKDSVELAIATHIKLELTDKKHAIATLYNREVPLKTEVSKGRLRKGYFRVKHDLSFSGVPPFYWSMSSNKKQFGLGKQGELFIDQADETNGSILIIMAGTGGFTTSYTIPKY